MGGKSKPTIGYWYRNLIHLGLGQVLDAVLELRGGDRTAWAGRAEGGTVTINARNLWGGEKAEGGIEGEMDVMLGHADQEPNPRLAGILGDQQSAYRGRSSVAFEGLYGAFNPYPKAPSIKGVRIFEGWEGDVCWYPEKAAIMMGAGFVLPEDAEGWSYQTSAQQEDPGYTSIVPPSSGWSTGQAPFAGGTLAGEGNTEWPVQTTLWLQREVNVPSGAPCTLYVRAENGALIFLNGELIGSINRDNVDIIGGEEEFFFTIPAGASTLSIKAFDENPPALGNGTKLTASIYFTTEFEAMNPAHMLYDSLTHSTMQAEPIDLIDDASFTAAADTFYDEGFGLCTKYNPANETPEQFQQRICNVVGANLSRSRIDGKYYLVPNRGVHDLESLPILTDDDILEYEEEPSDPLESVNQVTVEWFDPLRKKKRTTAPLQSLGSIQAVGGVIAEVVSYLEIPDEQLALRVGARDLGQKASPLKRFRLTTNRVPYAWRGGSFFRLMAPRRGIADMVCLVGEIDAGTPRSGSMRLVALQEVTNMPAVVYVSPEPGVDTAPSQTPSIPSAQQLLEAPYVDLAGDLPAAELAALADDVGFVLAVAARPTSGLNFALYTGADGEALADRGNGDWCPTALIVEAGTRDPGQVAFTLENARDLSLVVVGTAALWGEELVRVDAIDPVALTLTIGRGCGDTTPQLHAAGERIWFYDTWAASDRREYAAGETVNAKLLTRTSSQMLDPALASELSLELDERAVRPYPPGGLAVTDELFSDVVDPLLCVGELTASWVHRDRLLQADQLVDAAAAGVGPEAGTSYTVRYYVNDVLEGTEPGITGTASSPFTLSADGAGRIEVEAVRDGYTSWQAAIAEFDYLTTPPEPRVTDATDLRFTDSGDRRITD